MPNEPEICKLIGADGWEVSLREEVIGGSALSMQSAAWEKVLLVLGACEMGDVGAGVFSFLLSRVFEGPLHAMPGPLVSPEVLPSTPSLGHSRGRVYKTHCFLDSLEVERHFREWGVTNPLSTLTPLLLPGVRNSSSS